MGKFGANGTWVEIRKLVKSFTPRRQWTYGNLPACSTDCIKNVKFKVITIRTGCHYVGCLCYSENLNWAAENCRLDRMRPASRRLDIAVLGFCNFIFV